VGGCQSQRYYESSLTYPGSTGYHIYPGGHEVVEDIFEDGYFTGSTVFGLGQTERVRGMAVRFILAGRTGVTRPTIINGYAEDGTIGDGVRVV
jgi:hypothetical protein